MGKSKPPAQSRSGLVSDEDRAMWEHTARTLEPLARASKRAPQVTRQGDAPSRSPPSSGAVLANRETAPLKRVAGPRREPAKTPPSFAEIGRRQSRKLGTGQVAIDAHVDLHGLTRPKAHAALRAFLFAAREREARWVLVITGKGAPRRPGFFADEDAAPARESGVLRRDVPLWLGEPDLRAIVVGFGAAGAAHGGDGAFYVQLRQRRRGACSDRE